jgi:CheY-like chemotaxis protein
MPKWEGPCSVAELPADVERVAFRPRVPPLGQVVIVLDSNEDTVNMLRIYLERSGFVVFGALTQLFRDGQVGFDRFVAEHQPRVIVYDVTVPYEQSWALFQYFRGRPVCRGVNFVLTTTNVARVEEIARPDRAGGERSRTRA